MNKPYLTLNSLKHKASPKKIVAQDILRIQKDKPCQNNFVEFLKKKEPNTIIKRNNDQEKKNLQDLLPIYLQDIKFNSNYKKPIQSPRSRYAQLDKSSQSKQMIKLDNFPQQIKLCTPKSVNHGGLFTPQYKKKINDPFNKKQIISGAKELSSKDKITIQSSISKEKCIQQKRNQILSVRSPQQLQQNCFLSKSVKLSQFLKTQQNLQNFKQLKDLKERISTNSSNKTIHVLKINDFQLGKDLGKGKFGNVKIARHKKTGMLFSIKIINKLMVKQDNIVDQLIKQTKIQSFLKHSHIVKLYSVFDDLENVYLLMELCCQGNLYQYMQKKGRIPQLETSQFMKQTCQAVRQLHFNKIIHRDIKPQNIVLCFGMLKICDFGWSTEIKGTMRQTFCGSPLYISPQLLKGQLYDQKVDLWSLGILGYQMMTGAIPFQIITQRDLIKILNSKISYPSWMSTTAISFLQQLLQKNPQNRSSVQQLLSHPFIDRNKQFPNC